MIRLLWVFTSNGAGAVWGPGGNPCFNLGDLWVYQDFFEGAGGGYQITLHLGLGLSQFPKKNLERIWNPLGSP